MILVLGLSGLKSFVIPGLRPVDWQRFQLSLPISLHQAVMDFNSPFGYPGEGPLALNKFGIWILVAVGCSPLGSFWTSVEGASRGCCFEKKMKQHTGIRKSFAKSFLNTDWPYMKLDAHTVTTQKQSMRYAQSNHQSAGWWLELAFSWLRGEPFEHHVACPFQLLLALLTVCLCWGWIDIAGVLGSNLQDWRSFGSLTYWPCAPIRCALYFGFRTA